MTTLKLDRDKTALTDQERAIQIIFDLQNRASKSPLTCVLGRHWFHCNVSEISERLSLPRDATLQVIEDIELPKYHYDTQVVTGKLGRRRRLYLREFGPWGEWGDDQTSRERDAAQ